MSVKNERRFSYAVLVLPAVLIYLVVVTFPTIFSVLLSLTNYSGGPIFGNTVNPIRFVGLDMYSWMLTEPTGGFYTSLRNNMLLVGVSVFGQIPLGFILAYVISRKLIRKGTLFFQSMIFMPFVISPIIIGVLFNAFILNRLSVYFEVLGILNRDVYAAQLAMLNNQMLPVLVVVLWMFTGFYMIIFIAHLGRIDPEMIEAARIDGAGEGRILTHVVLPLVKNEIITCMILAISGSLRTFDLIFAMTGTIPQTRVLSIFMFDTAFGTHVNWPLANAISTVMVLISIILIIVVRVIGRLLDSDGGNEGLYGN